MHDMDFVRARIEIIEQALRVKRAAGPGDGNKYFHCANHARPGVLAGKHN